MTPWIPTQPLPIESLGSIPSAMLRNVGAVNIPPWSLVEIVDVYETAVADPAPIVGNLVLNVRRPTTALATGLACSGPIEVPVGKMAPGFYGPLLPLKHDVGILQQFRPQSGAFAITLGTGPLKQITTGRDVNLFACDPVQPVRGFVLTEAIDANQGTASIVDPITGAVLGTGEILYDPYGYYTSSPVGTEGPCVYCRDGWLALGGSGGGTYCGRIGFEIISVDGDSALVRITHRPCGCSLVPEEEDGEVTVWDDSCYFGDETAEALAGRKGTATYFQPDPDEPSGESTGSSTSSEIPCRWVVDGLCCPTD